MKIKWKREALAKWYNEFYYVFVHHHHDLEEQLYVPWLKEKAKELPDVTSVDHKTLLMYLDKFKTLFTELAKKETIV